MNKLEVRFSKSAKARRGCGQVTWSQFQAMLRSAGILMAGQRLEKVTVDKEKIIYSTNKTGDQK